MKDNKNLLRGLLVALLVVTALVVGGCSFFNNHGSNGSQDEPKQEQVEIEETIQVPYLVQREDSDAFKIINNVGLMRGEVKYEYSDTVKEGIVISQDPKPLTKVKAGTRVSLVVSKGKEAPNKVKMPDVMGMTQEDAERAIKDAKLVPVPGHPEYSNTVKPGMVCKQSVPAGTELDEGSNVTFSISLGKKTVKVPETKGKTAADARDILKKAGLGVDSNSEYSSSVAKDLVIKQSVAAGTEVTEGTTVTITVSLGKKPVDKVKVPDIMTYKLTDAQKALGSAGLKCVFTGDTEGTVIAVSPAVGTEVEVGSTVTITLQHVVSLVAVPDLSGLNGPAARTACELVGLELDYDVRQPERILIGSEPAAGTLVDFGTMITAKYEDPKPITVAVPDVAGMNGPDALNAMEEVGLDLDFNVRQPDDLLVGTEPAAGTEVEVGTMVLAIYPEPQIQTMGDWTAVDDVNPVVSTEEKAVFDKAGLDVKPVAVLAKQVETVEVEVPNEAAPAEEASVEDEATLEGAEGEEAVPEEAPAEEQEAPQTVTAEVTTYAFLCKSDTWSVVTIKVDADGNVSVLGTREVDITNVNKTDAGSYDAWKVPDAPETKLVPKEAQGAFDKAYDGYVGIAFKPVATLATQPVAGENYLIFATGSSPDSDVNLVYVLTVYQDADGEAVFADVSRVDLASYLAL